MEQKINKLREILKDNILCYNKLMEDFSEKLLPQAEALLELLEFDDKGIVIPTSNKLDKLYAEEGLVEAAKYVLKFIRALSEMYAIVLTHCERTTKDINDGVSTIKSHLQFLNEIE